MWKEGWPGKVFLMDVHPPVGHLMVGSASEGARGAALI